MVFSRHWEILARAPAVKLWDVDRRAKIATLGGHTRGVTSVAFSPDAKILAGNSRDAVRLWELDTQQEIAGL